MTHPSFPSHEKYAYYPKHMAQETSLTPRVHTFNPETPSLEASILDRSNPNSVVNLVPEHWATAIEALAFEHPEFLDRDERTLMELLAQAAKADKVRAPHAKINATDNRLRIAFWNEYNRAQEATNAQGRKMRTDMICAGICTRKYVEHDIFRKAGKLAWIITPPTSYTNAMEEALLFGVEKLRDMLDIPIYDKSGKVDLKSAEFVLRAVNFLDQRVKGAIVQKVDTRSLVLHGKVDQPQNAAPQTLEEIKAELVKLEHRSNSLDGARVPLVSQIQDIQTEVVEAKVEHPLKAEVLSRFEE